MKAQSTLCFPASQDAGLFLLSPILVPSQAWSPAHECLAI